MMSDNLFMEKEDKPNHIEMVAALRPDHYGNSFEKIWKRCTVP